MQKHGRYIKKTIIKDIRAIVLQNYSRKCKIKESVVQNVGGGKEVKKINENLKVVIYARYSSDSQREESIDGQLRECKEFAEKNGITVFASYIDRALSAKTDNRPEFQKMIKDSYKKLFDVVLVWKLDRFARHRYDSAHYKMLLKKNNIKVISATERISEGSEGIILEAMLEGLAEYYSVELAEKIGRGLTENALKARLNGGAVPIGYVINKNRQFEVEEAGAFIVREVFTRYSEGETMTDIVKDLTRRGIRSSRGNIMKVDSIHHMLKNRRYLGEYRFRDIVKHNAFPPIIEKNLFDRVQEIMKKNAKAPARHKAEDDYILTTKLRCGKCGAFMVGESGTSKTGAIHHYYKCVNAKRRHTCDKKPVKKIWIENIVVKLAMKIASDDALVTRIADGILNLLLQDNTKLPQLKVRLKEIEDGIQNMLNAIQQGVLTSSTKQRLTELEEAQAEIQIAIMSEELQKPELTKEHIVFWITRFRTIDLNDLDSRKRLIDTFVNTVYLYDDSLMPIMNYREGTKTISFDELKEFDDTYDFEYNNANIGSSDLVGLCPPLQGYTNHPLKKKLLCRFLFHFREFRRFRLGSLEI